MTLEVCMRSRRTAVRCEMQWRPAGWQRKNAQGTSVAECRCCSLWLRCAAEQVQEATEPRRQKGLINLIRPKSLRNDWCLQHHTSPARAVIAAIAMDAFTDRA